LGYLLLFKILLRIPYFNRVTLMVYMLIVQDSGINKGIIKDTKMPICPFNPAI
jgi:hypothetical protein